MELVMFNFRNSVLKYRSNGVSANTETQNTNASASKRQQPLGISWGT
jgi:hypothetical protein